jgi:hypothetical protein
MLGFRSLLLIASAFLWTGCASKPFLSPPTVQSHEQHVPRAGGMTIASAWESGSRFKPGMTEAQVLSILGAPDQKADRRYPSAPTPARPELHWFYRWPVYIGYSLDLTFERRGDQWLLLEGNWWDG